MLVDDRPHIRVTVTAVNAPTEGRYRDSRADYFNRLPWYPLLLKPERDCCNVASADTSTSLLALRASRLEAEAANHRLSLRGAVAWGEAGRLVAAGPLPFRSVY